MTLDDFIRKYNYLAGYHYRHRDLPVIVVDRYYSRTPGLLETSHDWYIDVSSPVEYSYKNITELRGKALETVSQEYLNLLFLKYSNI